MFGCQKFVNLQQPLNSCLLFPSVLVGVGPSQLARHFSMVRQYAFFGLFLRTFAGGLEITRKETCTYSGNIP